MGAPPLRQDQTYRATRVAHVQLAGAPDADSHESQIIVDWRSTGTSSANLTFVETAKTVVVGEDPAIRELFEDRAAWWHEATAAMSSPEQKVRHSAYRRIVGMGLKAVPHILRHYRDHGGHWYLALTEITHEQPPIPEGLAPNLRGEREAWLRWGTGRGFID